MTVSQTEFWAAYDVAKKRMDTLDRIRFDREEIQSNTLAYVQEIGKVLTKAIMDQEWGGAYEALAMIDEEINSQRDWHDAYIESLDRNQDDKDAMGL